MTIMDVMIIMAIIIKINELHPCLQDLTNARIREADFQKFAGSCFLRGAPWEVGLRYDVMRHLPL